jgi:plastocyanin
MSLLRYPSSRAARFATAVAFAAVTVSVAAGAAQNSPAHPAHIHSGTCEELGDVVASLTDVAAPDGEATGAASALPLATSQTRVEMPLQAIIDGGHAVNVHKSADEINVYVACGAIGGVVNDDELVVGLGELNESGASGVAVLTADGDATEVTVYLVQGAGAGGGAGAATEGTAPASAEGAPVEIKSFAYNPETIEVPAGGSVTWTNQDNVPHTATGLDRAVLQSGAIVFDGSFTQTFETPGTFEYFCEFHPNMKGTVVVK